MSEEEYPAKVQQALAGVGVDAVKLLKDSAGEHAARVDEIIRKFNVSFGADTASVRIRFYVDFSDKPSHKIGIGTIGLTRLWAIGFAYYTLYNAVAAEGLAAADAKIANIDFAADPQLDAARKLLHWAILAEVKLTLDDLDGKVPPDFEIFPPEGLPVPFAEAAPGSVEEAADQIAFMAMAFLIHHEFAHVYREHVWMDNRLVASLKRQILMVKERRPDGWSNSEEYKRLKKRLDHEYFRYVLIEKEADTEAARWLLEDCADPEEFSKRALGVAIGLSWLASADPYLGPRNSPAYPPGYDRL